MKTENIVNFHSHYRDNMYNIHSIVCNYYKGLKPPYQATHYINSSKKTFIKANKQTDIDDFKKRLIEQYNLKEL